MFVTYYVNISVTGCHSDRECPTNEACYNGQCSSPCQCGANAMCDVINHKATCKCPAGYTGNPATECNCKLIFANVVYV